MVCVRSETLRSQALGRVGRGCALWPPGGARQPAGSGQGRRLGPGSPRVRGSSGRSGGGDTEPRPASGPAVAGPPREGARCRRALWPPAQPHFADWKAEAREAEQPGALLLLGNQEGPGSGDPLPHPLRSRAGCHPNTAPSGSQSSQPSLAPLPPRPQSPASPITLPRSPQAPSVPFPRHLPPRVPIAPLPGSPGSPGSRVLPGAPSTLPAPGGPGARPLPAPPRPAGRAPRLPAVPPPRRPLQAAGRSPPQACDSPGPRQMNKNLSPPSTAPAQGYCYRCPALRPDLTRQERYGAQVTQSLAGLCTHLLGTQRPREERLLEVRRAQCRCLRGRGLGGKPHPGGRASLRALLAGAGASSEEASGRHTGFLSLHPADKPGVPGSLAGSKAPFPDHPGGSSEKNKKQLFLELIPKGYDSAKGSGDGDGVQEGAGAAEEQGLPTGGNQAERKKGWGRLRVGLEAPGAGLGEAVLPSGLATRALARGPAALHREVEERSPTHS
uniref:histone-lysine N-methyltransferase 2B-like n=1 Tax=Odobenus rosmarus divergens TaxID=9708 RepID=UPI00063C388F|nr:PREDICTED: histone-lysine N-methyltransferase 2B-like [Odobenus rosmarus divergens]